MAAPSGSRARRSTGQQVVLLLQERCILCLAKLGAEVHQLEKQPVVSAAAACRLLDHRPTDEPSDRKPILVELEPTRIKSMKVRCNLGPVAGKRLRVSGPPGGAGEANRLREESRTRGT